MKQNVLIVEGETDQQFLEGYLAYLRQTFPRKYIPIDCIEYQAGQDSLAKSLEMQRISINKGETNNIGIMLDADDDGIFAKIERKINPAIARAFEQTQVINAPNTKYPLTFGIRTFHIFCYIVNLDGTGELEDLAMQIIRWQDAPTPQCLQRFVDCLGGCNELYPIKQYKKEFMYFYGYDCLIKQGLSSQEARDKAKHGKYYDPRYWDFDHASLNDLRQFLMLFGDNAL